MLSRKAVLDRLDELEQEIRALKAALAEERDAAQDKTKRFLRKCGGWKDNRSPEEIIAEIYAARSSSLRKASFSDGPKNC